MQLNITELDNTDFGIEYEKIPENLPQPKINVVKKGVHFEENYKYKPIHQPIPTVNAKMVRQKIQPQKPKISYEDILSKMGMFVSDGKLHLVDRNILTPQQEQLLQHEPQFIQPKPKTTEQHIPKNSYIYNKYFKDDMPTQPNIKRPRTLHEYTMMLVDDYIEKHRIKQMKSKKLVMPTNKY
jgi:hypothetical protein